MYTVNSFFSSKTRLRSPAIADETDCTALSRTAMQHADDGYSRRGNFDGSLVHSMCLMYSPDHDINVYDSRDGAFEQIESV